MSAMTDNWRLCCTGGTIAEAEAVCVLRGTSQWHGAAGHGRGVRVGVEAWCVERVKTSSSEV